MAGAITLEPMDPDNIQSDDVSDDAEVFEQFRSAAETERAGVELAVYRVPTDFKNNPTGEEGRHLFSTPIDRYDLPQLYDRIKKEYMPRGYGVGTFRLMVRRKGMRGIIWKKLIVLEKGMADDEPLPPMPEIKSGDPAVSALADALNRQNELLSQLFMRQQAPQNLPDPMAQTERMLAMVASLTTAINGRPVAAGPSQTLGDMASGFREMLKLSREFGGGDSGGGGDEEGGGVAGVLKAAAPFADVLKALIERQGAAVPALPAPQAQPRMMRREPPRAPAPPRPQPPRQNVTAAGGSVNEPGRVSGIPLANTPGENAVLMKIVEMTNDLIQLRNGGGDPALIGKTFAGMVPPNVEDQLLDLLDANDWFEKLCAFNPAVAPHRDFFQIVRDSMLAEYEFEAEIPAGAEGTGEDAPLRT
jgi:hypothetical protein